MESKHTQETVLDDERRFILANMYQEIKSCTERILELELQISLILHGNKPGFDFDSFVIDTGTDYDILCNKSGSVLMVVEEADIAALSPFSCLALYHDKDLDEIPNEFFENLPCLAPDRHAEKINENFLYCVTCGQILLLSVDVDEGRIVCRTCQTTNTYIRCILCHEPFLSGPVLLDHMQTHITCNKSLMCPCCNKCFLADLNLRLHECTCLEANRASTKLGHKIKAASFWLPGEYMRMANKYWFTELPYDEINLKDEVDVPCTELGEFEPLASCSFKSNHQHICRSCGKEFRFASSLRRHSMCHASLEERQATGDECKICNKLFTRGHLSLHMLTHTGVRPHACHLCLKRFVQKSHLITHMAVHSDERNIICQHCGKTFKRKSDMWAHMCAGNTSQHRINLQSSVAKTSLLCDVCGKSFARRQLLKGHKIVHSDLRPFSCEICGSKFRQKSHLRAHKLRHNGQKLFVCQHSFYEKGNLKQHQKTHAVLDTV